MNKFSNNVTKIISYSREEAQRMHSSVVMPGHLMLALLRDETGTIQTLLEKLNINVKDFKEDLEKQMTTNYGQNSDGGNIHLSDMTNEIIRMSVLEARKMHLDTIDAVHLFMALLNDRLNNEAKSLLTEHSITYDSLMKFFDRIKPSSEEIPFSPEDNIPENSIENESDFDEIDDEEEDDDVADPFSNIGNMRLGRKKQTSTSDSKTKTPVLDKFSHDLTMAATEGKLDPCVGREREIERVQEIICRRKKNNPILIGEPGVGKSAIVEGLAQAIQQGRTSPVLFNRRLISLDLTSVVAGTKYRGQFEERIKNIIKELEQNPDIIVFIDEIHTIIGAGAASGSMDVANILKPALARGTIQCIGATTLDEYRKSIEKDGALERRFQKVMVEATTKDETLGIIRNLKEKYEKFHHVKYSDDAILACVNLTDRYITNRAFPDKAIDVLDEVGSRKHLSSAIVPPSIVKTEELIADVRKKKKDAVLAQDFEKAAHYRDQQIELENKLAKIKANLQNANNDDSPMITAEDVANVVSMMSGIPVHRISNDEYKKLRNLADTLKDKVIGQPAAIQKIVKAIQRNRMGLRASSRPIGVFMFLGPTGVGKTYLAQQLAIEIFGSIDNLIRIDMSEYNESFNTSRLVGAPPGYVGYDEGGQLTERVRRHPYSIVLLDEIEKAHSNVYNLLLQVLDEGRMTDGNGRLIDFRNTIIIMTSNAGTRQLKDFGRGIGFQSANALGVNMSDAERANARAIIQKALLRQFQPEFLNRLDDIITFDQLDLNAIRQIITLELKGVTSRVEQMGYKLRLTDGAKDFIAEKGYDVQYGARPLKRALQTYVEDIVCDRLLGESVEVGTEILITKKDLEKC